jgi:hypothetical protein
MDEQGNIHYINGDPFHLELININEDGNIIDLFGWQVRLLIFDINNNTVKEITEADCDVSVPGTLIISQTANQMVDLKVGQRYYYDLKLAEPGKELLTWINNKLFIVE